MKKLKKGAVALAPRKVVRGAAPVFLPKNPRFQKGKFAPRLARTTLPGAAVAAAGPAAHAYARAAFEPEAKDASARPEAPADLVAQVPEGLDTLERAATAEVEVED